MTNQSTTVLQNPARPRNEIEGPFIAGWGQLGVSGRESRSEDLARLTKDAVLSRGLGRSYGDAALPPAGVESVATMTLGDRILSWDPETGAMRAEAGLDLWTLNRLFIPQRWFVPVSPGTQFVTLGGMVAADVHGKNHHVAGCIGAHITELVMRVADGRIVRCGPGVETDLFNATVGGMGLTGHILEVAFLMKRLTSSWIYQETEQAKNIDDFMRLLEEAKTQWPATMGWIDCLSTGRKMGRGIIYRGRWATEDEAPKKTPSPKGAISVPVRMPSWALNRFTTKAFNTVNYGIHGRNIRRGATHYETFYYPLDKLRHWHRLYGSAGFTQYQVVLPRAAGPRAAADFLTLLTKLGGASFLCVIKDCGPQGAGILSFPMEGISIALDIPVRSGTQALVDILNAHIIERGGRIYLAKDTFTRPDHFRAMEPRLAAFNDVRRRWDPKRRIRSALGDRLLDQGVGA